MFSLKSFFNKSFLVTTFLVVGIFFAGWMSTQASIIIVDDPSGDDIDNGLCSIVEAMQNAGLDNQSGSVDCTAGSGSDDVISIQTDITLTSAYTTDGDGIGYGVPSNMGGDITINGNDFTIERDSGAPQFRIFFFSANTDIEINNLTISGGDTDTGLGKGGGMYVTTLNSLALNNVTFDSNTSVNGGALYVSIDSSPDLTLTIDGSTFSNNTSGVDGGAIFIDNSSNTLNTTVLDSTFEFNTSGGDGGAIFSDNIDSLNISDSTFDSNTSGGDGGAVFVNIINILDVSDSYFTANTSTNGGVFYLNNSNSASVDSSYFYLNRPNTKLGGVFYITSGSVLTVSNSTFENNVAVKGGVFYLLNGAELTAYNSTFKESVGVTSGGIIYSYQDFAASTNQINFYHNTGSASFSGSDSAGTFLNCIFDEGNCLTSVDASPFVGDNYIFENNILSGCDGNLVNASFLNNLGGSTCLESGSNPTPTSYSFTLELNGGLWKTLKLLSGSNAIDAGVAGTLGCPATDGRGVARPSGAGCDIGAYEYTGDVEVVITESSGSTEVSEPNTTDTYTINLGEGPDSTVTINLAKSDSDFDISPSSVTFTTLNWFTPQTITVTAVDNSSYQGDRSRTISHTVSSSDATYSALTPDSVTVDIFDDESAPSSSSGSSGGGGNPPPPSVSGCTDSEAENFVSNANVDDGSCEYLPDPVLGCTNASATNYTQTATEDDGSCIYPPVLIYGCLDSSALNYDSSADTSDGSCLYEDDVVEVEPDPIVAPPVDDPLDSPTLPSDNFPVTPSVVEPQKDNNFSLGDILGEDYEKEIQAIPVVGLALPVLVFMVTQPAVAASIPVRIWSFIPTLFGLRRKRRPWGTVYDSVTKQPLDPVHLTLKDEYGKEIATTITDLDGRFGFLVPPGKYKISANKSDYEFPSKKLFGKEKDELYSNLYFNETIELKEEGEVLIKNIPMDATNFNWNEFSKNQNRELMKFYSQTEVFMSHVSNVLFYAGIFTSVVLIFTSPSPINIIVFGIYAVIFILRIFGVKPKKPGNVSEKDTGYPVPLSIMRIFSADLDREISHAVVNKNGKYYSLVPDNNYYVKISEKVGEDEYKEIYTSPEFKVKGGYIGKRFKI